MNNTDYFSSEPKEKRTFTTSELAEMFGVTKNMILYIKARLNMNVAHDPIFEHRLVYSYSNYMQIKNYMAIHKITSANDEQEPQHFRADKHELVKNKKWLNLATFPTYEEITPSVFLED